jgi:hypothetical protein
MFTKFTRTAISVNLVNMVNMVQKFQCAGTYIGGLHEYSYIRIYIMYLWMVSLHSHEVNDNFSSGCRATRPII